MAKIKLEDSSYKIILLQGQAEPFQSAPTVSDLIAEEATDELVDSRLEAHDFNTDVQVGLGVMQSEFQANVLPGSIVTGFDNSRLNNHMQFISGRYRTPKALGIRGGTTTITPLGAMPVGSADVFAAATMIDPLIADAAPGLSGTSVKFSSFIQFEAYLNVLLQNAFNRPLPYNLLSQAQRIALLMAYERDLGALQEIVNYFSRIVGWHSYAVKRGYVTSAQLVCFNDMQVVVALNNLVTSLATFKTIDPDFHAQLQFYCDYHFVRPKTVRIGTIIRRNVSIGNAWRTGSLVVAGAPTQVIDSIMNPYLINSLTGYVELRRNIPISNLCEMLYTSGTSASLVAVLNAFSVSARNLLTNYSSVIQMLAQAEAKGFVTLRNLSEFLYASPEKSVAVEPYYTHVGRSYDLGLPKVEVVDNAVPRIYCENLFSYATGGDFGTANRTVPNNFVWMGPSFSQKRNEANELIQRVWTPILFSVAATKDVTGLYVFMNPFTGLLYNPESRYTNRVALDLSAATEVWDEPCDLDTNYHIGVKSETEIGTAKSFAYLDAIGFAFHATRISILAAFRDVSASSDELWDKMIAQEHFADSADPIQLEGRKDVALQLGYITVVPVGLERDDSMVSLDAASVSRLSVEFGIKCWPAIASKAVVTKR